MSYDYLETGISLNGVPLEKLAQKDMIHLAEIADIVLDCDLNDRKSVIAVLSASRSVYGYCFSCFHDLLSVNAYGHKE